MAAAADIIAFNGAGTPVSVTFKHISTDPVMNGIVRTGIRAHYREWDVAKPVEACSTIDLVVRMLKSGVTEVQRRVETPVMEVPSGGTGMGYTAQPKVAYIDTDVRTWYVHPRSSVDSRRRNKGIANNLDNNVSTTVTQPVTGVIDGLIALLSVPQ